MGHPKFRSHWRRAAGKWMVAGSPERARSAISNANGDHPHPHWSVVTLINSVGILLHTKSLSLSLPPTSPETQQRVGTYTSGPPSL
ncbi:hypothetical protein NPIL_341341 [Nephila pilipes]|uniref:Uncharacterized protein n=1 Tax=Nephila pilipes TaxID=299642 RepID=A0A8X6Q8I2_NEPPI|nr:hypothetical protein NPIL_341341 [Nephila pilipes]